MPKQKARFHNIRDEIIGKTTSDPMSESKKRAENPYLCAFDVFEQDLDLLRELNRKLPKSEEQISKELEKNVKKIASSGKPALEALKKLVDSITSMINDAKEGVQEPAYFGLNLTKEESNSLMKMITDLSYSHELNRFIRNMSLVYLVTEFESFLRRILEATYEARPEVFMYCQKTITYEELMASDNIDDVKRQIIEKESSYVVNQGIEEVVKYLEQKFHLDLTKFKDWKKLKERFHRRNVLVHNSGMIDRPYRLKTGYKGTDKMLIVSDNYLRDSIDLSYGAALDITEYFYGKFK